MEHLSNLICLLMLYNDHSFFVTRQSKTNKKQLNVIADVNFPEEKPIASLFSLFSLASGRLFQQRLVKCFDGVLNRPDAQRPHVAKTSIPLVVVVRLGCLERQSVAFVAGVVRPIGRLPGFFHHALQKKKTKRMKKCNSVLSMELQRNIKADLGWRISSLQM